MDSYGNFFLQIRDVVWKSMHTHVIVLLQKINKHLLSCPEPRHECWDILCYCCHTIPILTQMKLMHICTLYSYEYILYGENPWVCAKWQWNARDCVNGLHDRLSPECNPVTPFECVSLSFRTHPCVLAFIIHLLYINGSEMTFVWLIWCILLYVFFNFAICFIVLMNLGETCHLQRRDLVTWRTMLLVYCYYCNCMQQHYDVSQFNMYCDVTQWTNGFWVFITNLESPKGHSHSPHPSKQWAVCDNNARCHKRICIH